MVTGISYSAGLKSVNSPVGLRFPAGNVFGAGCSTWTPAAIHRYDPAMRTESLKRRGYSVAALRAMARRRLPRMVFDFVDGGAETERTLRRNEQAFGEIPLWPRPVTGTAARDQSVDLFGERLSGPVLIGPTGLAGMLWPRGEVAAARAAASAGTVYTMSHGSTVTIEDLARDVSGRLWMQVFLYRDRGLTRGFVERAKAAGYRALM